MLEPVIQFFERLVTQFSWGRLSLLLAIAVAGCGGLLWYESYTGNFRLKRIEHSAQILEKLTDLSPRVCMAGDEGLSAVHKALVNELRGDFSDSSISFTGNPKVLNVIAAAVPWFILGLLMSVASRKTGSGSALAGMTGSALPFIALAWVLPDLGRWINWFLYPFGSMFLVVAAVTVWSERRKNGA